MYYIIYVHYICVLCNAYMCDDVCTFPTYTSPPTVHTHAVRVTAAGRHACGRGACPVCAAGRITYIPDRKPLV